MPRTETLQHSSQGADDRRTRTRPAHVPDMAQVESLLLQALETEMGGLKVYETALECAQDPRLVKEWTKYHDETKEHERIMLEVLDAFGVDPHRETPDRAVVRHIGTSLVDAMRQALASGNPVAAQLVAAECVTLAETKDHLNWQLIGEVSKALDGELADALKEAYDEVEDQEDEHLYHTMGWCRELWLDSLRLPSVLPPPEEKREVKSMAAAARAKSDRKAQLPKAAKARGRTSAKGAGAKRTATRRKSASRRRR